MQNIEQLILKIKKNDKNVRFVDIVKLCEHYFGKARQCGSSHMVFKTPWQGDPRVNIQNKKGKAKAYQVRQILKAISRLKDETN